MNDLFGTFTITDEMRKRAEENREGIESQDMESMRTYGIAFCNHFNTQGDFDCRGNPDGDMFILYVGWIGKLTVIIDGEMRWDTIDEFLGYIEDCENRILNLKKDFKNKFLGY